MVPSGTGSLPHVRETADTAKCTCPNLYIQATERLGTAKVACLWSQIPMLTKEGLRRRLSPGLAAIQAVAAVRLISFTYE